MKYYEGPICIALDGTLGAGKTHFSQGIAKGFGATEISIHTVVSGNSSAQLWSDTIRK